MSIFKGRNEFSSLHNQFIDKSSFQTRAYNAEGPEVFEFNFLEYSMYGTVNNDGTSIYPDSSKLSPFRTSPTEVLTFEAFDFVTNMYLDVRRNIQLALSFGKIPNDNDFISSMNVVRGYRSPYDLYKKYFKGIMFQYNEEIKKNSNLNNNITRFSDYVKYLLHFLEEKYLNIPITFSGWLQSNNNSIFTTGLALSIADIPFDDDNQKYDEFMSSQMFPFYKKVLLNRGFRIWKHCPYVLVADLASPATFRYINTDVETFLNNYYKESNNIDYSILYNIIIEYYNNMVLELPYIIKLDIGCVRKTNKTVRNREVQSFNNIDQFYWINFYLDVRNIELGMIKQKSEIKKMKRYLRKKQNILDNNQLTSYINNNFKLETFKKPFGLNHSYQRLKQKEQKEEAAQGLSGGTTIVGGSSGGY